MPALERVTVTLPADLVHDIDRQATNRSRFVAEAVRRELDRLRREALHLSLAHPHPDTADGTAHGLEDWADSLPEEDAEALLNTAQGRPLRWVEGQGWIEEPA